MYDTYAPQLEPYEKCIRDPENPKILNVFCINCGKQYRPKRTEVFHRISGCTISELIKHGNKDK